MSSTLLQRPLDDNSKEFLREAEASKFDFHEVSVKASGDERLKRAVGNAVLKQDTGRKQILSLLPDQDALRTLAGDIKQHALDYLDYYLEQLERKCRSEWWQGSFRPHRRRSAGESCSRIAAAANCKNLHQEQVDG